MRPSSLRRALLVVAAALTTALVAAQAVLPAVAEHQLRSALGPQAAGVNVDVRAVPAVKLLWHRADRVTITVDRLRPRAAPGGTVGDMLARLRVASRLDLRIRDLQANALHLRDVRLHKDGDAVAAYADVDLHRLEAALPLGLHVRPLAAPAGEVRLEGTAEPLGLHVVARAILLADRGRIVVRPEGVPFASLLAVPVFSDDRIAVDGLGARPSRHGLVLSARAHLYAT